MATLHLLQALVGQKYLWLKVILQLKFYYKLLGL